MRENTDQSNSEYGHFSCSVLFLLPCETSVSEKQSLVRKKLDALGEYQFIIFQVWPSSFRNLAINYIEETSIKSGAKKMKITKYQKLL